MTAPDFSRAARRPADRRALVEHVHRGGPGTIESDWLEWKSRLDLGRTAQRAVAAKHILGFANRGPDRARRNAAGCGYLLIGVEPGCLTGVPEAWDPAQLESWIGRYVGAAVAWDAHYVASAGRQVLAIGVEPPQWGDPLHPLRKESVDEAGKTLRNGTIFVRRLGKTVQADAAEIGMLTERARAGPRRLALAVEIASEPPEAIPSGALSADCRDEALERWRLEALRGVPAEDPWFPGVGVERRGPSSFRVEVDAYVERARAGWASVVAAALVGDRRSPLRLQLRNETERVFESVQLEAILPLERRQVATSPADAHDVLDVPEEPAPWHEPEQERVPSRAVSNKDAAKVQVEESCGSGADAREVLLRFDPVLVRPYTTHRLPEVLLMLPPALAGRELRIRWRATSRSTLGELSGQLRLPVKAGGQTAGDASLRPRGPRRTRSRAPSEPR
jgi:hypothetical protein